MPADIAVTAAQSDTPVVKKTLFFLEEKQNGGSSSEHRIAHIAQVADAPAIVAALDGHRSHGDGALSMAILTDSFEYQAVDQVIPLQPEQLFFMDYTCVENIKNRHVLEVGLGSGVLSNFCLLKGASYCSGLEINPRAKILTGFNSILNGVSDRMNIIDGDEREIFAPVQGHCFDFIFSNPPFEPTPPGMDYYFNSAAGIYGLDFVEALLRDINTVLSDGGTFQMVTMAPGCKDTPFMLNQMIGKYLGDAQVDIILDLQPITYASFVERFIDIFQQNQDKIAQMKQQAADNGVTHLHMLILKYKKGVPGKITTTRAGKLYETWQTPLGSSSSFEKL